MKKYTSFFFLLVAFTFFTSCEKNTTGTGEIDNNYDRKAMLLDIVDNIIIPSYELYIAELEQLDNSAISFIANPNTETLSDLKASWLGAYKVWQQVSMFEIGKAEEISLRNYTNIFPTNVEEIETNISSGTFNLLLPSTMDAQGFPAIEYLLFSESESETITSFGENERSEYLKGLTEKLVSMANAVIDDWNNGYRTTFIENDGTSATSSVNKLVNDFIFYYEKFLRAGKIGIPAGVFSGDPIPSKIEGLYSGVYSKELFLTSLDAVTNFFNGKAVGTDQLGEGLSSYLDYLNTLKDGSNLSQLINDQFQVIKNTSADLDQNFQAQINDDNIQMLATYDELQKAVILLKVDMLQALNVKVDFVDADGD